MSTLYNTNPNGAATIANSAPSGLPSDQFGLAADSAATTDTGTFTFMAFVKRILQKLTSLIALFPTALGSGASAAALLVNIATDQVAVAVKAAAGVIVDLGAQADSAATTDTGTFSLIGLIKRLLGKNGTRATITVTMAGISGSYVLNDQIGTAVAVANFASQNGGQVDILSANASDANDAMGAFDMVFLRTSPTLAADSAAATLAAADAAGQAGKIAFPDAFDDFGSRRIGQATVGLPRTFSCDAAATTIYVVFVAKTTIGTISGTAPVITLDIIRYVS